MGNVTTSLICTFPTETSHFASCQDQSCLTDTRSTTMSDLNNMTTRLFHFNFHARVVYIYMCLQIQIHTGKYAGACARGCQRTTQGVMLRNVTYLFGNRVTQVGWAACLVSPRDSLP